MIETKILFRLEAGPGIGLGHLQRCISLATVFIRRDVRCIFVSRQDLSVSHQIDKLNIDFHKLYDIEPGSEADAEATLEIARREKCQAIVVDFYDKNANYLARLRTHNLFIAAIDDQPSYAFPCHLVINGGVVASTLPYRSSMPDTHFLLGPKYALLREEFINAPKKHIRDTVSEVLVTMGGSDSQNSTTIVLEALGMVNENFIITTIVGPYSRNWGQIKKLCERIKHEVQLVSSPKSMSNFMFDTDLAISAAGQTLYELAITGTPTIAIQVTDNQAENLRGFAKHGAVTPIVLGDRDDFKLELSRALPNMINTYEKRIQSSTAGKNLIDGLGAERIRNFILEALKKIKCR